MARSSRACYQPPGHWPLSMYHCGCTYDSSIIRTVGMTIPYTLLSVHFTSDSCSTSLVDAKQMVLTTLGSTFLTLQIHYGFGRHTVYVLPELPKLVMYNTIVQFGNTVGVCFVKISVCLFTLRFIKGTHKPVRIMLWVTIAITVALTTALVVTLSVSCIPFRKIWDEKLSGTCIEPSILNELVKVFGGTCSLSGLDHSANSDHIGFGVATDFLCVIVPCLVLHKLQMDKRTKITIGAVILLGLL